jgi:hypothetical protein
MKRTVRPALTAAALALVAHLPISHLAQAQSPPTFSNPTKINNPYFPVSKERLGIALGVEDGLSFRTETTLLPGTKTITWDGGTVKTRIQQYVAYLDGDIIEVAYDWYAQADDGTVWYFGEDVFNYEDGVVVNTDGTWIAEPGAAPPGIIMPGKPFVGQVFNPENYFPIVWEEDTIKSLTHSENTPKGPINDAMYIDEKLLDGSWGTKTYAKGFGELRATGPNEDAHLAVFNQAGNFGYFPAKLDAIESHADDLMYALPNWTKANKKFDQLTKVWNAYKPKAAKDGVPTEFIASFDANLADLKAAMQAKDGLVAKESANDIRMDAVDMMTVYNPEEPTDLLRFEVMERELILDVKGKDWTSAMISHSKCDDALWARLRPFVIKKNGVALALEMDSVLDDQRAAVEEEHKGDALEAAWDAIELMDEIADLF